MLGYCLSFMWYLGLMLVIFSMFCFFFFFFFYFLLYFIFFFFFSSRRRHTRLVSDWSSDVCSSDLLQINRGNVEAMSLMQQGRIQEADVVLQRTLAVDPRNPFTLNNLGYAMEAEGNLEKAVQYYSQAANLHSSQNIIVALDRRWRGKSISDVASGNAKAVRRRLESEEGAMDEGARLSVQGVSALNRIDPNPACQYIRDTYPLEPKSAFTLNNIGYIAQLEGDQ